MVYDPLKQVKQMQSGTQDMGGKGVLRPTEDAKPAAKPASTKPNPYAKAKAKDSSLDSYIKTRNSSKKGTRDYAIAQNKINEAYGVSKRYDVPDAVKMEKRGAVNVNTGERLKINNNAVGKGGNSNSSIKNITSSTAGTGGNKASAGSSMKPITLKTDLDSALKSKFGANSATSTSNMSLMKSKVDAPASVVSQKGTTPIASTDKPAFEGGRGTVTSLGQAKKLVRQGAIRPDDAGAYGLGYGKDYDKLVSSRAYKKQKADEGGFGSVRKMRKSQKEAAKKSSISTNTTTGYEDAQKGFQDDMNMTFGM
jgi:hypothetical protein